MKAQTIEHLNLYVPADSVDDLVRFYRDFLGFDVVNLDAYRDGDRSLFTLQPADGGFVLHAMPVDDFEPPGRNINHVAVTLDASEESIEQAIDEFDVTVDHRRDRSHRRGADIAIYVEDPCGYLVELRPGE